MAISEKTRMILSNCKYYDEIVDYPYVEGDILSEFTINEYSREIFDVDSQDYGKTNFLKVLDLSVYEFLRDFKFNKKVKDKLKFEGIDYNSNEDLISVDILNLIVEEYKLYRSRKEEEKEDTIWL